MATDKHSSVPEGFKEISGYDGRYFINEKGEVWSTFKHRVLTQHLDSSKNYLQSLLMVPGRKTGIPRSIHKLMAITWLGKPPGEIGSKRGQYCINHKDGNKLNNHVDNLEWMTSEENLRHAWENGLNTQIGNTSTLSVLTSEEVRSIRIRLINGEKPGHIAKERGVGKNCIEKLRMYANWKHQDHDLIEDMLRVSRSKTLHAFCQSLAKGDSIAAPYKEVEQITSSGIKDYNSWWYYCI
jgi:hypothetical protein